MLPLFLRRALGPALLLLAGPAAAGSAAAPEPLRALAAEVLASHPRAAAARAELEAARAALRGARLPVYNPELEAEAERAGGAGSAYVQLSQTLDVGGLGDARGEAARARLEAARARLEGVLQALVRDLLVALGDYAGATREARLAQRRLELMRDFARFSRRRAEAGDLGPAEVNLARLALSEAAAEAAAARSRAMAAAETLRTFVDPLPDPAVEPPGELPAGALPRDPESVLRTLPGLRALRAQVQAAEAQVAARRAESRWEPSVALRGGRDAGESLLGLSLSLPLKVRNPLRAEVDEARALVRQAQQALQEAQRLARARLLASAQRYRYTRQAWEDWESGGLASVRQQLELLERLWRSGDMSTTDYLVQLRQTLDTQAAGIALRTRLWRDWCDWLLAAGRVLAWLDITPTEGPH